MRTECLKVHLAFSCTEQHAVTPFTPPPRLSVLWPIFIMSPLCHLVSWAVGDRRAAGSVQEVGTQEVTQRRNDVVWVSSILWQAKDTNGTKFTERHNAFYYQLTELEELNEFSGTQACDILVAFLAAYEALMLLQTSSGSQISFLSGNSWRRAHQRYAERRPCFFPCECIRTGFDLLFHHRAVWHCRTLCRRLCILLPCFTLYHLFTVDLLSSGNL